MREKKTWDRHTVLKDAVGERALDEGAANERSHPRSHLQMRPVRVPPQPGESTKTKTGTGTFGKIAAHHKTRHPRLSNCDASSDAHKRT